MRNNLLWIGGLVTSLYVCGFVWFAYGRLGEIQSMQLNNLGDFLAGAFGPVALFWLVLGFIQQGKELRVSSEALVVQTQELRSSVEQQKELVDISAGQLNMARENAELEHRRLAASVEPKFSMSGSYRGLDLNGVKVVFKLVNGGHAITCVDIDCDSTKNAELDLLGEMQDALFTSVYKGGKYEYTSQINVTYLNGLQEIKKRRFFASIVLDRDNNRWVVQVSPKNGV